MRQLILIFLLLSLVSCGNRSTVTETVYSGRVIEISDSLLNAGLSDTIDLGQMREGEIVSQELMIRNTGSQSIVILSVETSCGCTSVEFPHQPILPSEQQPLIFTFDSQGYGGWQFKSITLRTSLGYKRRNIFITAQVQQ